MNRPPSPRRGHFSGVVLGVALLILVIQLYLFETVLQSVLDGRRAILPGAFIASLVLTAVVLILAFKVPRLDEGPKH